MFVRSPDSAFERFKRTGDAAAMTVVFDLTAGELMKMARHLASTEAEAEDLLQATFVTAIQAADDHENGRPVLPWLVGVLANHARVARRRGRRAPDPSRLTGLASAMDPAEWAERRELQAEVEAAICRLPETFRLTLRLYLQDGLEPIEIAKRLEEPPGTIRARLSRGLESLRRNLPNSLAGAPTKERGSSRGLQVVRAAVLLRCGQLEGSGAAATAAGSVGAIVLMNKKVILGALGALLLGGIAYVGVDSFADGDGEPDATPERVAAARVEADASIESNASEQAAERVDLPGEVREAKPEVVAEESEFGSVRVQIRRARGGEPAQGVGVNLSRFGQVTGFAARLNPRISDSDGVVLFEDVAPGSWSVEPDRANGKSVIVKAGQRTDLEIELPAGVHVRGVVVDGQGQPVGGARVILLSGRGESSEIAQTDRLGGYRCRDLAPGLMLRAQARGHVPSLSFVVSGAIDTEIEMDLVLRGDARTVSGRVLDSSGQPLPGAVVALASDRELDPRRADNGSSGMALSPFLQTDEFGRYRSEEVAHEAQTVVAHSGGLNSDALSVAKLAAGTGDAVVDLQLRRGAVVYGRVLDGDGPLEFAHIIAWPEKPADDIGMLLNLFGFEQVNTGPDGNYRLEGLVPGDYSLKATRGTVFAQHRLTLSEGQEFEWSPNKSRGARIRLQFSPSSISNVQPFYGWMVTALERSEQGGHEYRNAATSGADGMAELAGIDPGEYDLVVRCQLGADGRSTVIVDQLLDVSTGDGVIEWSIPQSKMPSARIRGRILENGLPVANKSVMAVQTGYITGASVERMTGRDGTYSIGPLAPGTYELRVIDAHAIRRIGSRSVVANQIDEVGDFELSR